MAELEQIVSVSEKTIDKANSVFNWLNTPKEKLGSFL